MFHFYPTGQSFLDDNAEILTRSPLETVFFEGNAKNMPDMRDGFAVKVWDGGGSLLALRLKTWPMVLFGEPSLCGELAACLWEQKCTFTRVLTSLPLAETFFTAYEALAGGGHRIRHAMTVMCCRTLRDVPTDAVSAATEADVDEIAGLVLRFHAEALGEIGEPTAVADDVRRRLGNYAIARWEGRIAAIACRNREMERLCAVSGVYTLPEARGHGLARQVVTALTRDILQRGKLPYLFVEQKNPVSNHLYQSIGYTYEMPQYEIDYDTRPCRAGRTQSGGHETAQKQRSQS